MNYRIGLDIGITSIGWAILEEDSEGEPIRIVDLGTRIFDKPENPKTGASLAEPRRTARGMRRRVQRHRYRIACAKEFLIEEGIIDQNALATLFNPIGKDAQPNVWQLRVDALSRKLSSEEWTRVLIHYMQRRGFKSNRKSETADSKSEAGKLLVAVKANASIMQAKGYRTVAEMFMKDQAFIKNGLRILRNKSEDYSHTLGRDLILQEIRMVFNEQRRHGSTIASAEFEDKIVKLFERQRSFDQGPGAGSPYAGNQIEKMIGKCTFVKGQLRAARACYSSERFMLITRINNLRIRGKALTEDQKNALIDRAYASPKITYAQVREIIQPSKKTSQQTSLISQNCTPIVEDFTFPGLSYGKKEREEVEKATFVELKAYHDIRKALDKIQKDMIANLTHEQLDAIGYALTAYKNDDQIRTALKGANLQGNVIEALLLLSFSKTMHLSTEAIKRILPFMEQGMDYDKACLQAGFDFQNKSQTNSTYLPVLDYENITNPLAVRALSQATKMINAIIRTYGAPKAIHIETAREMSKNFEDRKKEQRAMEDNQAKNDAIRQRLIHEFHVMQPKGEDIVKLKLWEEQGGRCMYTNAPLDATRIFNDVGYCDVDHIIPYSICFKDGYDNKVLVLSSENRQKGNRLPFEYLSQTPGRWENFEVWVRENKNYRKEKRQNLLKKSITPEEEQAFKDRNLNDTRYISRTLAQHIRNTLQFAQQAGRNVRVVQPNGMMTDYMRKRWGLNKVRDEGDKHHAQDAVVIACTDATLIHRISIYHKRREAQYSVQHKGFVDPVSGERFATREEYDQQFLKQNKHFPTPWKYFREELLARLTDDPALALQSLRLDTYPQDENIRPIFVSRAPRRAIKGAAHKETVLGLRKDSQGKAQYVKSVALTSLKLDQDGEIDGYYNPGRDKLLYEALKTRLNAFGGDAKEAFKNPICKPKADGTPGPKVNKVKIVEKMTLGVPVHGGKGIAANDNMIRIDVFRVKGKYRLVPIYLADTLKAELPNRAVVAHKAYEEWQIVEDKDFLFSLYPNDLVRFEHKRGIEMTYNDKTKKALSEDMLYYKGMNISSGNIELRSHDNKYGIEGIGVATLNLFEKYQVDLMGNISKVGQEKRMGFAKK